MLAQLISFILSTMGPKYLDQFDASILRRQLLEIPLGPTPAVNKNYTLPYDEVLDNALIVDIRVPVLATATAPSGANVARTDSAYLNLKYREEFITQDVPLTLLQSAVEDTANNVWAQGAAAGDRILGPLRMDTNQKSFVRFGSTTGLNANDVVLLEVSYFKRKS